MSIEIGDGGLGYIYLGDVLIAGGGGSKPPFTPSANTLAYFPFEDDALDHSGNGVTLSGSGTKGTIGYNFTAKTSASVSNVNWFCSWVKVNSNTTPGVGNAFGSEYNGKSMGWYLYDSGQTPNIWTFYTSSYAKSSTAISNVNQWNFIGVGYDGTNTVYCFNNTYGILRAGSGYNFSSEFNLISKSGSITFNVSLSDFIIESVAWSSSNALTYYNATKSKYGIS